MAEPLQPGDVIQIVDVDHVWYPALLIVDEVRAWGVQAYCIVPHSNDGSRTPGLAYTRLGYEGIARVGAAHVRTPEDGHA